MLCAVPALRALRRAHPSATLSLVGLPASGWMLDRYQHLLDELLPFPGFPGIPEWPWSAPALERFVERVRLNPFDLAVQMHGSGTVSNAFTALIGARRLAGLYDPDRGLPEGPRFFPYPSRGSEVHRCLFLTESLDYPSNDDSLEFPVSYEDREALRRHPSFARLDGKRIVCLHPGAREGLRRWPAGHFAAVADALTEDRHCIVLTGTKAERSAAEAVAGAMRQPPVNLAGETSLGMLAALLERASLLITNDTGVSHLAAALRTPSVIVFLASDPDRWAPHDRVRHRPVLGKGLDDGRREGMRVSPWAVPATHEVLDEASLLLNEAYDG